MLAKIIIVAVISCWRLATTIQIQILDLARYTLNLLICNLTFWCASFLYTHQLRVKSNRTSENNISYILFSCNNTVKLSTHDNVSAARLFAFRLFARRYLRLRYEYRTRKIRFIHSFSFIQWQWALSSKQQPQQQQSHHSINTAAEDAFWQFITNEYAMLLSFFVNFSSLTLSHLTHLIDEM